jgi:repressor LexA
MKENQQDKKTMSAGTSFGAHAQNSKDLIHLPHPQDPDSREDWPGFGAVIQKYRKKARLSQPKMAQMMEVNRNTITNWENNKNRPSLDDIKILCETLGIPLYELFGMYDEMIPTPKERTLLRQYRKLSSVSKKFIESMIRNMLQEETDARNDMLRNSYFILPLQSTPAAAGPGCDFNELKPEPVFIKKNRFNTEADTLIRVSGRSMEPVYHNGDLVYVKYTKDVENNDIVICSSADGAVIKRLYDNKLYSLNPNLPYGEKNEDDHVQVIGKVLGTVSADEIPDAVDVAILREIKAEELYEFDRENQ